MPVKPATALPRQKTRCSCFGRPPVAARNNAANKISRSASPDRAAQATCPAESTLASRKSPSVNECRSSPSTVAGSRVTGHTEDALQDCSRNRLTIPKVNEEKILDQMSKIRLRGRDQSIIRAGELWQTGPAMLLLIRRPGCSKSGVPVTQNFSAIKVHLAI